MRPAIFFDRDGTLNEEVGYAGRPEEFHIFPFAAEAVQRVNRAGWAAVLITNQAGVAKGLYLESAVESLHQLLREHLQAAGAHLDGIYYCPHHPKGSVPEYTLECECRKPKPGMAQAAARDLGLDLAASIVIGDRMQDVGLARAVGARGVLVRSGYGTQELANAMGRESSQPAAPGLLPDLVPDLVMEDALAAVRSLLPMP